MSLSRIFSQVLRMLLRLISLLWASTR